MDTSGSSTFTESDKEEGFTPTPIEDQASLKRISSLKRMSLLSRFIGKKKQASVYNPQLVSGFTLLELLVVMAITVVLAAMVAGYSRESSSQLALASTESKMLSLINRAKFLSIETYFGGGRSGDQRKRICAYGVKVDKLSQEIFIFQDLSSEEKCPPAIGKDTYDEGERLNGELNEIKLENTTLTFGETDLKEVVFVPPDPQTKIRKTDNSEVPEAKVLVKLKEGNGQFVITVNKYGQIKAE